MSVESDLRAARALIVDPNKWVKHSGRAGEDYCAITACGNVEGVDLESARLDAMWSALKDALPPAWQHRHVYDFNDHPTTTHQDILDLFDRAIEAAAAKGK